MHRMVLLPADEEDAAVAVRLRDGSYTVGRGVWCDIVINDSSVSREHARLVLNGAVLTITDLRSQNGTFVGNERIHSSQVRLGQVIRFGAAPFRLALESSESLESRCDDDDETTKRSNPDTSCNGVQLTASQKRVFDLLLKGVSETEIANRLDLSVNTVHTHVSAIYSRFGVHSRAELLARCLRANGSP
ncbi:MAG: FHA domain-containing protein [Planctomycetaceae bacterium]